MFNFGWASREIMPDKPAMIQGQMHIRISQGTRDPIMVTALAMDNGNSAEQLIFISCDMTSVSDKLKDMVNAAVHEKLLGIPVILNATHTHESLVIDDGFYPQPEGDILTADEAVIWIAEKAVDAALEAWEKRAPGKISRGFGHAVVGHNRRSVYDNGLSVMYGNTNSPDFSHIEGFEDHSMDMVFLWDMNDKLSGMMLDIPCPSQVDEQIYEFSADYWHDIRVEIKRRFGNDVMVLPLCGASGDQSPHPMFYNKLEEEMNIRRGVTERQEIALRVAEVVARTLPYAVPVEVKIAHSSIRLPLSPRPITMVERDWAAMKADETIATGMQQDLWWPRRLRQVVELYDNGQAMPQYTAEIHAVRIGDIAIITNPFELFLDYGMQMKARSIATQTIVVQLAMGSGIYLPTERGAIGGHYGAHPAISPVGPQGGKELVEASLKMIEELFKL